MSSIDLSSHKIKYNSNDKLIIDANTIAARIYHNVLVNTSAGKLALKYLRGRKVSDKVINDYHLGFAPKDDVLMAAMKKLGLNKRQLLQTGLFTSGKNGKIYDYFFNRIMYPITDWNGRIIAFSGRVINKADSPAKYLNTKETDVFHKGETIFNLDKAEASIKKNDRVILVEGYMDVLSAYQAGVKNVIASMGTGLTKQQIKIIKTYTHNVTVCYDGDTPGQDAISRALDLLDGTGIHRSVIQMPNGIDPDEYRRKYGDASFRRYTSSKIKSPLLFLLSFYKRGLDMHSVMSQLRYLHKAVKALAYMKPYTTKRAIAVRSACIKCLSKAFNVKASSFRADISAIRTRYIKRHSWGKPSHNPLERTEQMFMHDVLVHPKATWKVKHPNNLGLTSAYIEMYNIIKFYYRKHHKINVKNMYYLFKRNGMASAFHAVVNFKKAPSEWDDLNRYIKHIQYLNGIQYWYGHINDHFREALQSGRLPYERHYGNRMIQAVRQLKSVK